MVARNTNQFSLKYLYQRKRNLFSCFLDYKLQLEVWRCFEGGNYFGQGNTENHWMNFLQKSILLAGRNIVKFWKGEIHKPSSQTEILQNSQEVIFISHQYRQKYWKISQEGGFINHQRKQKYRKKSQNVEFISHQHKQKHCKISQKGYFINHHYKLKYFKILKRWNL